MYFSARTEGRISYGHLGRTNSCYVCSKFARALLKNISIYLCILAADRKPFFILGRKRKCRRKWNSIYGRKRNESENRHSFSAEKRKSPDNFSFFSYIQSPSQPYNALPIVPRTVSPFFCRWQISLWHFSRWHFNPLTVCFPGLLLSSESNFLQSMHCALLASVSPYK